MNNLKEFSTTEDEVFNDLFIVLGKNIGVDSSPEDIRKRRDFLSQESRMNATAVAMLWKPGCKIIFSSGPTSGPDTPAEAEAMKDYVTRKFPNIPLGDLLTEDKSIDTAGNAEEVARFLRTQNQYKSIGLVTVGYHLKNAEKIFKNYYINISNVYASEDIVRERSTYHDSLVNSWLRADRIKQEYRKEKVRTILLKLDKKGKLLRLITSRTRKS